MVPGKFLKTWGSIKLARSKNKYIKSVNQTRYHSGFRVHRSGELVREKRKIDINSNIPPGINACSRILGNSIMDYTEPQCYEVLRNVLKDLFEQLEKEGLILVRSVKHYGTFYHVWRRESAFRQPDEMVGITVMTYDDIKMDNEALHILAQWAIDEILPEDD